MSMPNDCHYTKDHEWVKVEGSSAIVGITDFAQSELGELVFVELPSMGKQVKQKDPLCVVESTKAASDVYSPVSGTVSEVNSELTQSPNLVNTEPYTNGWIAKLSNINVADLETLMDAGSYKSYLETKV